MDTFDMFGHFRGGANQDAADEALRTGQPVKLGFLERLYGGTKEDAENIVKRSKQDQLKSTYGTELARLGLMVDWGESEQSVKSKIFKRDQERKAKQKNQARAEGIADAKTAHLNSLEINQQGIDSQEARYAHTDKQNRMDRRHERELSEQSNDLQMNISMMQNDLAEKRMDYDRETRRLDKRSEAIAQLMGGLGQLGGAFSL